MCSSIYKYNTQICTFQMQNHGQDVLNIIVGAAMRMKLAILLPRWNENYD